MFNAFYLIQYYCNAEKRLLCKKALCRMTMMMKLKSKYYWAN